MKNRFSKTLLTILLVAGMILPGMSQEPATSQELPDQLVLNLQGAVDHAISYNKALQKA